ncbi:MAG: choloylglycine hydrolase family protein [Simkaniaceae bacterium]|nr:choloylglycine hydrolase family protein [Simkaniaceae bacterium]
MRYFVLLFTLSQVLACTDFLLIDEQKGCVVGRSMEWSTPLDSELVVFPKGEKQHSIISGKVAMQWQQKYDFFGLSVLGMVSVLDGVNEKGLAVEGLWFPIAKYPTRLTGNMSKVVSVLDFANWALGTCATVAEVQEALETITIYPVVLPALKGVPKLHFAVHDATGKSIVVEFIDGKMVVDENPIAVMTNAPSFSWHLTNLENYINLTAVNKGPVSFDGTVIGTTGQGSGLLGIPGDWTPPSRFVRIALFKNFAKQAKALSQNVNLAFHLLNTVDIPFGTIQSEGGKDFDYTQWAIVKDLHGGSIQLRTYTNLDIQTYDLNTLVRKGYHKIPIKS